MATPVTNFGLVKVNIGYAAGATSIALDPGEGSKLPATTGGLTYPLTWWNRTDYAHPALDPNVEIVLVTGRSTDTLTVTRAQEGTSASSKNSADKEYYMSLGITKLMWETTAKPKSFVQGLQLQTHRDSDLQTDQVELVNVESIIMDDGTELRNDSDEWTGKLADITVSGAGGLDTGAEANGYWYEIYAIAKEDGTRNLLLHLSKLWNTASNYPTGDDTTQPLRSSAVNADNKLGQGFTINESGSCVYAEVKLARVGTPTGKIWLTIHTNAAGVPSSTVVATSQAFDVSRIPTTAATIRIPMKTSEILSASPTLYHLVLQGDYTVDGTNYIGWRYDASSPTYANGAFAAYDSDGGGAWSSNSGHDAIFAIINEVSISTVTMPTDYTKKCFLGWVFNNGDGDFRPFLQVGRAVRYTNISQTNNDVWTLSGSRELLDFYSWVPPQELVRTYIALTGTGTGGALAAVGDLRATDLSTSGTSTGAQAILATAITSTMPSEFGEAIIQFQGAMVVGTANAHIWAVGFDF
jgi:hypothetical protein